MGMKTQNMKLKLPNNTLSCDENLWKNFCYFKKKLSIKNA